MSRLDGITDAMDMNLGRGTRDQMANSLEKSLMLGKIEGRRRRGHQRMRWLDNTIDAMNMNFGKLWELMSSGVNSGRPGVLQSMG